MTTRTPLPDVIAEAAAVVKAERVRALSQSLAAMLEVEEPQPRRQANASPVLSSDGKSYYQVMLGLDGAASCTCAWYEHNPDGPECRHIKEIRMTNAVAVRTMQVVAPSSVLPSKDELESMDMVAARLYSTGAVALPESLKTKQDVMSVILAGWELGVKPGTAIRHISVIKGKAEPDGQLMAGIVTSRESNASFTITHDDGASVSVRFRRPSRNIDVEYTYSLADATKAGLAGQMNWSKFPRDMMRWAAIKRLCRTYANDLINGIMSTAYGEMPPAIDEVDDADVIDGEVLTQRGLNDDLFNEGDDEPAPAAQEARHPSQPAPAPTEPPAASVGTSAGFWQTLSAAGIDRTLVEAESQRMFENKLPKDLTVPERKKLVDYLTAKAPTEEPLPFGD